MNPSRSITIVILLCMVAIIFVRIIHFRRLHSRNASDRLLKILSIFGLAMVLLFVVSEVLLQTPII